MSLAKEINLKLDEIIALKEELVAMEQEVPQDSILLNKETGDEMTLDDASSRETFCRSWRCRRLRCRWGVTGPFGRCPRHSFRRRRRSRRTSYHECAGAQGLEV